MRDFTGHTVGRITVLSRDPASPSRRIRWLCRCECGAKFTREASVLVTAGPSSSCGCAVVDEVAARRARTEKACSTCGEVQPLERFHLLTAAADGRRAECRTCYRWRFRRDRYGITRGQFLELLAAQAHRCGNPGCDAPVTESSALDHDHETGAVRSVMCDRCNMALGLLDEDDEKIVGLVTYLETHRGARGALVPPPRS